MPRNARPKYQSGAVTRPRIDVSAFRGEWIALDPETYKILGHGASLEEARRSTPNLHELEPLMYFVPRSDAFFIGVNGASC